MSQRDPQPKPVRKRAKKPVSEPTAVDTPIDPIIWILLGGLLIVVGGFFYLDSASAESVDTRNGGSFIQVIFALIYGLLGRNLAFGLFGGGGALLLIWGIIGKVKRRPAASTSPEETNDG